MIEIMRLDQNIVAEWTARRPLGRARGNLSKPMRRQAGLVGVGHAASSRGRFCSRLSRCPLAMAFSSGSICFSSCATPGGRSASPGWTLTRGPPDSFLVRALSIKGRVAILQAVSRVESIASEDALGADEHCHCYRGHQDSWRKRLHETSPLLNVCGM
jgi:hypothetical protein